MLESATSGVTGSQSTLIMGSASSMSSHTGRRHSYWPKGRSRRTMSGNSSTGTDTNVISRVADAQNLLDDPNSQRRRGSIKKGRRSSKSKGETGQDSALDALTPIREFAEEELDADLVSPDAKESKMSADMVKSYVTLMQPQIKKVKEVHIHNISISSNHIDMTKLCG